MWDQVATGLGAAFDVPPEAATGKLVADHVLLKRQSVPEDVAKLVSFLASEEAEVSSRRTTDTHLSRLRWLSDTI